MTKNTNFDESLKNIVEGPILNSVISGVVISGLSYYFGWTVNAAYYAAFGLPPDLIDKNTSEIISSAWIEISLLIFLICVFALSYKIIIKSVSISMESETRKRKIIFYFLFFIIVGILMWGIGFFLSWTRYPTVSSLILTLFGIYIFWIAIIIGRVISSNMHQIKQFYPGFYFGLAFVVIALIFGLQKICVYRAVLVANGDILHNEELPSLTIFSSDKLSDLSIYDQERNLFITDGLKLIDANSDVIISIKEPEKNYASLIGSGKINYYLNPSSYLELREIVETIVIYRSNITSYKIDVNPPF